MKLNKINLNKNDNELHMFLTTNVNDTNKMYRAAYVLGSLIGNKNSDDLWWTQVKPDAEIYIQYDDYYNKGDYTLYSQIPPRRTLLYFSYEKEEKLNIRIDVIRIGKVGCFDFDLYGANQGDKYIPSKRELVQHLEDIIDNENLYNKIQCSTKNKFMEHILDKEHKLNTMLDFNSILAISYNAFELHDLNVIKECYMELYDKSEEEGALYIEKNKKLLTEFYGFSDYENFNKLVKDLKYKILI